MVVSRTQGQHREFAVTRFDPGPATLLKNWSWLVLSLLALSTSWLYMHRIQGPWEYHVNVDSGKMKAQLVTCFRGGLAHEAFCFTDATPTDLKSAVKFNWHSMGGLLHNDTTNL